MVWHPSAISIFLAWFYYLGALPKVVLRFKSVLLFYISTCNPSLMPESCLHLCDRFLKHVCKILSHWLQILAVSVFLFLERKCIGPKNSARARFWFDPLQWFTDWRTDTCIILFLPNEEQNFQHQKDTFRSNKVHFNISSSHSGLICWSPRP